MTRIGAQLARLLRQRRELGERELFLEQLTATEATGLLARAPEPGTRPLAPGAATASAVAREVATASAARAPAGAGAQRRSPGVAATPEVSGPAPSPDAERALRALAVEAAACTLCRLHEGRRTVVFGDGAATAEVVVVGEAPGAEEDRTGLPFVGPAGKLLDLLLASVGLPRDRVYICNVLKCRPPGNRDPLADEVATCSKYLRGQLQIIRPSALLAVGRFAAQTLLGSDRSLGRLRGEVHAYEGVPLVVTYHPAFLLRSPQWTRTTWEDFQLLRSLVHRSD